MRISVLGAGSWGTTMAALLSKRHDTLVWAREPGLAEEISDKHHNGLFLPGHTLPDTLRATGDLVEATERAQVLVIGIPTHAFRAVLDGIRDHVPPWIPVVSLAKGLEQGSHLRMTQVVEQVLPGHPPAALTGPNLAKEILSGKAAATVIATENATVAKTLQEILQRGLLRVYTNGDVAGCELGGALKNVIAIAAGMAEGLAVGDNTRAAVITRGLAELTQLGVAMGGRAATFAGLTGLGDLMATCLSQQSRNRHVGEELGKGRALPDILDEMVMVAEGVRTTQVAVELGDRLGLELPICRTIGRVLDGEMTAKEAYAGLRNIPAGEEAGPW
ncbi:NAD(P)H-dependent glycerol-3-phosphate dehydrogenase [Actinomadura sp. ATCC 31491]|uniref:Glycerol-3-phosphate dehydrogenase [NAD(P)+] n=1 Tax=Actinomadura luzonensis TaxID=2805427 RepID=A0ABT0FUP8_9ACTN|nr:NAD(P)H-dependent glycerol-3-phosphate dehydrogenase [Actinomadura luzonensis]MCK2215883.1 NAD(P)H-dependent glycerol-3-phosphate dehydrogenase [Actinomadura luzonensis]